MVNNKIKSLLNSVNNNINLVSLFFLPVIVLAMGNWFVASAHTFWIYDSSFYHIGINETVRKSCLERFLFVYKSMFNKEYNGFFTLFLFPFIKAFPFSRQLFISSILLVFFIPSILILRMFFKEILNVKNNIFLVYISFLGIIFIPFLSPTLTGFPDIFGYIPLIIFYIMYFKSPIENRSYKSITLMSFLFYMPFLIRRIYIYEIIAFTLFVILYALFDIIYNKKYNKTYIKKLFLKYFVFALVFVVFALCLQYHAILHIFSYSYVKGYSAYQVDSYYDHFLNLYQRVSKYYLIMAVLGSILGILSRYRKVTIFFTFNVLVTFFSFNLIQKMGIQHILDTISLGVFVLSIIAVICITSYLKTYKTKVLFLAIILIINVFLFLSSVGIKHSKFSKYLINKAIISIPFLPNDENYDEKLSVIHEINNFLLNKKTRYFYILTEGKYVRATFFQVYGFYYLHTLQGYVLWNSFQDARDLIKDNIFRTKYIIMESTGKSEFGEQKVVSIPFKDITQDKKNIGKAFKKTNFKYITPDGTEIWIYEKTRPFTKQEIQDFLNVFYVFYPEWKEIYKDKINYFYNIQ